MYTLKLKHHFAAAHHLKSAYSEECRRPAGHGHTFDVSVTVETNRLINNMVCDFKIIKEEIDRFDHRYLNKIVPFDPTAENMARHIHDVVLQRLILLNDERFWRVEVQLFEGPGASITYKEKDDAMGAWLAGFLDGEGYFMLYEYKGTMVVRCGFELRADDYEIAQTIKDYLGCGNLTVRSNKYSYSNNKMVVYEINKRSDLINKIIPILDKYPLRAKKKKDYQTWKKGVYLLEDKKGRRHSEDTKRQFGRLVQQLKEGRKCKEEQA